jgi:hypothetical protein
MRCSAGKLLCVLVWFLGTFTLQAATARNVAISAADAGHFLGQERTVCGLVASATFASESRGQPTFLNLDKPYPDHIFTIVIWGTDRSRFSVAPEHAYRYKRVCVTGRITAHKGKPEIIVTSPVQIQIEPEQ